MPKFDFYILSESDVNIRFQFTCRLTEKAYKNQHRVYIHTDNERDAHLLDELLWTYCEESFLPHNLYGEGPIPAPPIQIGFDVTPQKQNDILINLSQEIPTFYPQFNRVIEVVPNETSLQECARNHYRIYRAQGYDITTHKLQSIEV